MTRMKKSKKLTAKEKEARRSRKPHERDLTNPELDRIVGGKAAKKISRKA